ncbi:hypothetical protein [Prosthecobacter debontii]|nr:hypothetical protein [Prosthecobacter debontii]
MAAFFVAAIIRLWLLRRVEEQLLKNKAALEKQVVTQQKDLMMVRQDANAWRSEMQRQFDLFRHMASDQLGVEEKRFNELLSKSQRREYELLTQLDVTKQMSAELPEAKARILHLESLLEKALANQAPAPAPAPESGPSSSSDSDEDGGLPVPEPVSPMPDLSGPSGFMISPPPAPPVEEPEPPAPAPAPLPVPSPFFPPKFAAPPPPPPSPLASILPVTPASLPVLETAPMDDAKFAELEQKLAAAEKKNISLQLVLTKARSRSRTKTKPSPRTRLVKRGLVLQA